MKLLAFISEKLGKRLSGWYAKTLSLGGKEVLLKSTAMALPVYAMSCFRLTKHHCQKIMSAMAVFWWNECSDKKKIHWVSWPKLCMPKEFGGLGFRDIEDFNQALLAKQARKFLNEPQSLLAQIYKGRYYANKDFLECGVGYRPSYAWRSILFGWELLSKGLIKSIGNGRSTSVWGEKWIMDEVPRRPVNRQTLIDVNLQVSSLIENTGEWNTDMFTELFPPNEVFRIKQMPPGRVEDCFVWAYSRHGAYTVKTGYELLAKAKASLSGALTAEDQSKNALKRRLWKIPTLPKIKMFLWRAASGALAVAERLNSRGLHVDNNCKLCQGCPEIINHVLFQCSVARRIWSDVELTLPSVAMHRSFDENLSEVFDWLEDSSRPHLATRAIPWILWLIWKNMKSVLYAETQLSLVKMQSDMRDEVEQWFKLNKESTGVANRSSQMGTSSLWSPPENEVIKCNVHANWRNASLHSGLAWIARDRSGNVTHHARDAIVHAPNRMIAEI